MDPQDKEMLRRALELAQKNNKILNSIQKSMFWGKIFRYVYWALIIGAAIGAYYFIEPYVDQVLSIYSSFKGDVSNIFR